MSNIHELLYRLTYRDAVELLRTVRESEFCDSMTLEIGDMKLSVTRRRESGAAGPVRSDAVSPAAAATIASAAVAGSPAVVPTTAHRLAPVMHADESLKAVVAPTLGTFYRAPSPGEPPCIKEGDMIGPGQTIGLIEVMKLFTPIVAGVAGRVVEILVEDATLVEYGQQLALIDPS